MSADSGASVRDCRESTSRPVARSPHSTYAVARSARYARAPWSPVAVRVTPAQWARPSSTGCPGVPVVRRPRERLRPRRGGGHPPHHLGRDVGQVDQVHQRHLHRGVVASEARPARNDAPMPSAQSTARTRLSPGIPATRPQPPRRRPRAPRSPGHTRLRAAPPPHGPATAPRSGRAPAPWACPSGSRLRRRAAVRAPRRHPPPGRRHPRPTSAGGRGVGGSGPPAPTRRTPVSGVHRCRGLPANTRSRPFLTAPPTAMKTDQLLPSSVSAVGLTDVHLPSAPRTRQDRWR